MNPRMLVLLSLVAGAAAGAGLAVLVMPESLPSRAAVSSSSMPDAIRAAAQATPVAATAEEKAANKGPTEEYVRLAQALVALDERMAGIEERNSGAQNKVDVLLEDVRQLAMQLEIRSGQLRPVRGGQPINPLLPMQGQPQSRAPGPGTGRDRPGVTEDGLPQW